MKGIDLLASDVDHERKIDIQVKTKTAGAWQTQIRTRTRQAEPDEVKSFWILVDLHKDGRVPDYYIVPTWWMVNDIIDAHQAYLDKHGGNRAKNNESTHHAIPMARVQQWKGNWDVLGIFPDVA